MAILWQYPRSISTVLKGTDTPEPTGISFTVNRLVATDAIVAPIVDDVNVLPITGTIKEDIGTTVSVPAILCNAPLTAY